MQIKIQIRAVNTLLKSQYYSDKKSVIARKHWFHARDMWMCSLMIYMSLGLTSHIKHWPLRSVYFPTSKSSYIFCNSRDYLRYILRYPFAFRRNLQESFLFTINSLSFYFLIYLWDLIWDLQEVYNEKHAEIY